MARYEYECGMCNDVYERWRPVAERDLPHLCRCSGVARRVMSVPGGLGGNTQAPSQAEMASVAGPRRPGPTFTNCSFSGAGEVAVKMNGGHANFDGLSITKSPKAFDLNNGATVDLRNVLYEP